MKLGIRFLIVGTGNMMLVQFLIWDTCLVETRTKILQNLLSVALVIQITLVVSSDSLCKQFRSRFGPTKGKAHLKEFFENIF